MFEFQSVHRSFPRNLAENSEAASFLDQTTSFETELQEREPYDSAICRQGKKCKKTLGFPNQGERYGAKYENGVAYLLSYTVSVEKMWTQNTCIIQKYKYI
jgi:hypothetical protein